MPTAILDTLDNRSGAIVGTPPSSGPATLLWELAAGAPAIAGGVLGGGSVVLDLRTADDTVEAYLRQGGQLIFRYVDANNYWYVSPVAWYGVNADTPPVESYGSNYDIYSVVGGGAPVFRGRLTGRTEYIQWSGHSGYPIGAMDPFRRVQVITAGNSITLNIWTGNPALGTGNPALDTLTITSSLNAAGTRYGMGNTADSFAGSLASSPPNAPTPVSPVSGALERSTIQRLTWAFSDPDAGDTQSKYDLRWRLGAGAWTTVTGTTPNTFYDAPAATFPLGSIEWQVRTYDALGNVGPYSASAFFTAADTPGLPTITAPTNGAVVGDSAGVITWSAPAQESYQVRKVADNAGTADTATVYYDSGEVVTTTARTAALTYPTNNRYEHVQVRVKNTGLWSTWASVRVQVSYTPPLNPTLLAIAIMGAAAIQLAPTNPLGNLLTTNQASLETDTTGWAVQASCTIARSTAQSLTGAASLAVTSTGGDMYVRTTPPAGAAVVAGQVYTAVASFRAATVGRVVGLQLYWYAADGATILGTPYGPTTADNTAGWQQARMTAQAPAGAAYAVIFAYVTGAPPAGEVHYIDAVGLFPDPTGNLVPNPGFENGTTGWGAQGAAVLSFDTTQAYTGRASIKAVAVGTYQGVISANSITPVAGTQYTISAWVRTSAAATLRIALYNGGGAIASPDLAVPANTWTRLSITGVMPNAAASQVFVDTSGVAQNVTINVDAVQVVVGPTAPPFLPPTTANLVTNPSFDADVAGWVASGNGGATATITRDATRSLFGVACAALTQTGAGMSVYGFNSQSTQINGGQWYTVSAYFRAGTVGRQVRVITNFSTASGGFISQAGGVLVASTTDGWTRATLTAQAPANAAKTEISVEVQGMAVGEVHYIDGVQLEAGSVATPYVDGTLGAGYAWEAAENLLPAASADFEDGSVGGWTVLGGAGNGTIASSAARAVGGTKSVVVTPTGAAKYTSYDAVRVVTGTVYAVSAWVYSTVARTMRIGLSDNVVQASYSEHAIPANSWVRITHTSLPIVTSGNGGVFVQSQDASATPWYLDAVQVEQKDHASPYAAGSVANTTTSRRLFPWATPPAAVVSNDIYRRVGGVGAGIRVAKALAAGASWTDYTPASGVDYQYLVRAVGANGTTADSAWV